MGWLLGGEKGLISNFGGKVKESLSILSGRLLLSVMPGLAPGIHDLRMLSAMVCDY